MPGDVTGLGLGTETVSRPRSVGVRNLGGLMNLIRTRGRRGYRQVPRSRGGWSQAPGSPVADAFGLAGAGIGTNSGAGAAARTAGSQPNAGRRPGTAGATRGAVAV